jgi:uncharacterized protein YcnI
MKKSIGIGSTALVLCMLFVASPASAEVSVTPAVVRIGAHGNFTLGVTSEKGMATTMLRLVIPSSVSNVKPNVKSGWATEIDASGGRVQSLIWKGGIIPADHQDDFIFGAQVQNGVGEIPWRVYQTYEDGSVISWNLDPQAIPSGYVGAEQSAMGPYPITRIADDISASAATQLGLWADPQIGFFLSLLALVFSLISFNVHPGHPMNLTGKRRRK